MTKVMFSVMWVCLSVCSWGVSNKTGTCTGLSSLGHVETCSTWTLLYEDPHHTDLFKLVHYVACTVAKRQLAFS